jgi:hypothetical protein
MSSALAIYPYCGFGLNAGQIRDVDHEVSLTAAANRACFTFLLFDVDLIIIPADGGTVQRLTDLLGRSMGNIRETACHQFTIYPQRRAFETMADIGVIATNPSNGTGVLGRPSQSRPREGQWQPPFA